MEVRPRPGGEPSATTSTSNAARAEISALIHAGAYEALARLLAAWRAAGPDVEDVARATVLDAAAQLCLTCIELRREQDGHNEAMQRVARLEEETRLRIEQLLESVWRADETGAAPLAQPPSMETPQAPRGPSDGESALADQGRSLKRYLAGLFRLRPEAPAEQQDPAWLAPVPETEHIPAPASETEHVPAPPPETEHVLAPAEDEPIPIPPILLFPELEPEPELPVRPSLVVYLLGPFRVYLNDQSIDEWAGSKAKLLFKYLVATRGRPASQEVLMDLFWPQANVAAARNNLHVAIYGLRQTFHRIQKDFSHIFFRDDHYLLNPDLAVWVDVEAFQTGLRKGRELANLGRTDEAIGQYFAAEALYEGDFLEEDRYEEWPQGQRHRLREEYLELLDHLYRYNYEQGDYSNSVSVCRKMLALEPSHETAHRRLMRCYGRLGQRYLVVRQFHQCVEILRRDLDIDPSRETVDLYHQIR